MNILLLGGGGREHALAWKLAQSSLLAQDGDRLFAAPGNPGIAECAHCIALDAGDHAAVVGFCQEQSVGLVVIGPEAPLVDGLADTLREAEIPVFGPGKEAAQLEGSKGFTKDLCQRGNIPTAGYVRTTSLEEAREALEGFSAPYVLKADGLAAGKGVVIAQTYDEAAEALVDMFDGKFGDAGAEVVIEEFLEGEEASFFAITDGVHVVPFGTAQDHKRVGDGDTGPNTGGMGAYSPAPVLTQALQDQVMEEIILPTVRLMTDDGTPYSGVLYAGLMLTESGPQLIEYNCRFGDPECQVLMALLRDDLGELMLDCATQQLGGRDVPSFGEAVAMTVVMAAKGYPGTPEKGGTIAGIETVENDHVKVFHAGTSMDASGALIASGGRVLNVTAIGDSVSDAQAKAYAAVKGIDFPSGFYRNDIGWREVEREGS